MSNSADPSVRVGIDMFSLFSESSSGRARFPPSLGASAVPADWSSSFASGSSGMIRWPVKPPDPSAVQAQEPKTRVVPSGTALASLDLAIKFTGELVESPP